MPDKQLSPDEVQRQHAIAMLKAKREATLANEALGSAENKRDGVREKKLARIDAELAALQK